METNARSDKDARLGVAAAATLYDSWDDEAVRLDRQYSAGFAEAFLDKFSSIQLARANSVDRISSIRGGDAAAQLTEESYRGILEVLQNAEDEEADYLTVVLRRSGKRRQLLFIHNGNRVGARTVIAMTSAYLSLKKDDPEAIGKFGIGLKTLQRLGLVLEVHCAPYHWAVVRGDAQRIPAAASIPDLYEHGSGQTMLVLQLDSDIKDADIWEWFGREGGARTLLFLRHVRRFEYREVGRKPRINSSSLDEAERRDYVLQVGKREAACVETRLESSDGQGWRRYEAELPVTGHARRNKAIGGSVKLAVAVADSPEPGLIFSGLPTSASIGLPFDIGGPFDSDQSRERVDPQSKWNEMLLGEARKFVQALAIRELSECPRRAWALIGLRSDVELLGESPLLSSLLRDFVADEQRAVAQAAVMVTGTAARLRDVAFEAEVLENVLDCRDVEIIRPGRTCLPTSLRDDGRWRCVLNEILDPEIGVNEALGLLGHPLESKKPAWFVNLARAAVDAGEGSALFERDSVVLADGGRATPCKDGHGGLLVSSELAGTGLVGRLGLAKQIHSAYTAPGRAARTVREYLIEEGAFSDRHSADAVLRALAGRTEEPVALTDTDIGELAGFLTEASKETIGTVSVDLGHAVTVDGFEFIDGRRLDRQVLPADAYLPAAMDEKDGWAKAAGATEGLVWIHPRYAKLKSISAVGVGARKFFGMLAAESAPRLMRPDTIIPGYIEPAYDLGWWGVPGLWARRRDQLAKSYQHEV